MIKKQLTTALYISAASAITVTPTSGAAPEDAINGNPEVVGPTAGTYSQSAAEFIFAQSTSNGQTTWKCTEYDPENPSTSLSPTDAAMATASTDPNRPNFANALGCWKGTHWYNGHEIYLYEDFTYSNKAYSPWRTGQWWWAASTKTDI